MKVQTVPSQGIVFNPSIELARDWTLRGNRALLTGKRLKREKAEFVHDGIKHGVISINLGDTYIEKDIIVPARIKETIHNFIDNQRLCYTSSEGDPELIKSIARKYEVPDDEVFVVNGVTESIYFVARLFSCSAPSLEDFHKFYPQGRPNIILINPVYPLWRGILMEFGLELVLVERSLDKTNLGQPQTEEISQKINPATQAVVLITGDNPTGKVLSQESAEETVRVIKERKDKTGQTIFLVVDDIYYDFIEPAKRINFVQLSEKYEIPLILSGGIDKTLGTGLHGGWMICHVPERMKELRLQALGAVKLLFSKYLGANTITQYAMKTYFDAYETIQDDIKKNLAKFREWCNKFIKGLSRQEQGNLLKFKYGTSELPLYLWLEIIPKKTWRCATDFAEELVKETGVLLAPGDPFGDKNCIRISVVRDPIEPLDIPRIILDFMKSKVASSGIC